MFKLLQLEFLNHPFLKDFKIDFCGENEQDAENYTTLIIGPNGTGKSQILLAIVNIFNSLAEAKGQRNRTYKFPYHYRIRYYVNGRNTEVSYIDNELLVDGNNYLYAQDRLQMPLKLLVSSYSFNDKYPLRSNRGKIANRNYYYLGLKSTTNNIFIYNPPKEAIDNLCHAITRQRDVRSLRDAFEILGLRPEIEVVYEPGKHFKFLQENEFWTNSKAMSPEEFKSSFKKFVDDKKRKKTGTTPEIGNIKVTYGDEKIERTLDFEEGITNSIELERRNLQNLIAYLRANIRQVTNVENKELVYRPTINFTLPNTIDEFTEHIKPFKVMRDLGILSFERFDVKKLESGFSFENASSGEYHIIISFLNLLSLIEENSLVLIDEPEISLHPNWQIRYMDVFKGIFSHFGSCHFVIASHSHFMVSDLKGESSFISSLFFDEAEMKIRSKAIDGDTFGWSAEEILYSVFNVRTVRNYFMEQDLTKLLGLIGQDAKDRRGEIEELIKRIERVSMSDNDPLTEIINEAKAYLND